MIPRCLVPFHLPAVHRSIVVAQPSISTRLASSALIRLRANDSLPLLDSDRPRCFSNSSRAQVYIPRTLGLVRTVCRPPAHNSQLSASSSSSVIITIIVAATATVAYSTYSRSYQAPPHEDAVEPSSHPQAEEMVEIPPGRPGSLTPEQDELLLKLWARLFEVCGVSKPEASAPRPDSAKTDAESDKGKKKSRMGMFSWRRAEAPQPSAATAAAAAGSVQEGDPEDKYGQNKIFLETLANMSPEAIRSTVWSMVKFDHPDALLLRFLRARKWDIEKALVMLVSSMYWRLNEVNVNDIMLRGEEGMYNDEKNAPVGSDAQKIASGFMLQLRMGKSFAHGEDRAGRPVVVVKVRLHKAADQIPESMERYTIYLIETVRSLMRPPIDTANVIFDMTEFSMANMEYAPVKFMIKCFEANFPESLGVVLVHKAPWIFQGIWRVIRGWLDPVVAAKVNFTNDIKGLEEYIPLDKLPKELEGNEAWEYKYQEPIPGENYRMKDTATRDRLVAERQKLYTAFEENTIKMLRDPKDQAVRKERTELAAKLRADYWRLDPYIRARSFYDRTGVLAEDGTVNYYPPSDFKLPVGEQQQQQQKDGEELKKVDSAHEKSVVQDPVPSALAVNSTA